MKLRDWMERWEQWAKDRLPAYYRLEVSRLLKLNEEVGELNSAVMHGDEEKEFDALGDVLVCWLALCSVTERDPDEVAEQVFKTIERRTYVHWEGDPDCRCQACIKESQ